MIFAVNVLFPLVPTKLLAVNADPPSGVKVKVGDVAVFPFVNFIKTSTGFGSRGCSLEDIDIINKHKNEILEIKASGGIRDFDFACKLIEKGVTRLGVSNIDSLKGEK